jgi:hypothetical protein
MEKKQKYEEEKRSEPGWARNARKVALPFVEVGLGHGRNDLDDGVCDMENQHTSQTIKGSMNSNRKTKSIACADKLICERRGTHAHSQRTAVRVVDRVVLQRRINPKGSTLLGQIVTERPNLAIGVVASLSRAARSCQRPLISRLVGGCAEIGRVGHVKIDRGVGVASAIDQRALDVAQTFDEERQPHHTEMRKRYMSSMAQYSR